MKLVIQKWILLKTCVIRLWNIDNYESIYVSFSIFFCMLQVKAINFFWDLTTWCCCWILLNQLTLLLLLCLNVVKQWHREKWMPLKISQFWMELINMSISIYLLWGTIVSPKFSKGGSEKNDCLGTLKEFLPCLIFAWGLAMFLVKKRLSKIKYGFEFSISNVDLSLF